LVRTHQTAKDIDAPKVAWPQLNEISGGDYDQMTYEEIAAQFPIEFAKRDQVCLIKFNESTHSNLIFENC